MTSSFCSRALTVKIVFGGAFCAGLKTCLQQAAATFLLRVRRPLLAAIELGHCGVDAFFQDHLYRIARFIQHFCCYF